MRRHCRRTRPRKPRPLLGTHTVGATATGTHRVALPRRAEHTPAPRVNTPIRTPHSKDNHHTRNNHKHNNPSHGGHQLPRSRRTCPLLPPPRQSRRNRKSDLQSDEREKRGLRPNLLNGKNGTDKVPPPLVPDQRRSPHPSHRHTRDPKPERARPRPGQRDPREAKVLGEQTYRLPSPHNHSPKDRTQTRQHHRRIDPRIRPGRHLRLRNHPRRNSHSLGVGR